MEKVKSIIKNNKVFWIVTLFVFIIDILSKNIFVHYFSYGNSYTIIKKFFSITLSKNTGVAFSMLDGNVSFIIILTMIFIACIIQMVIKEKKECFEYICYGLVVGGALGNLFDRIIYGYVVDFLDFTILGYDYPIFNFADTFIVVGIFLLLFLEIRKGMRL